MNYDFDKWKLNFEILFKQSLIFGNLRILFSYIFIFFLIGILNVVHALPSFARQTGQSCVACHAGGQFPELTPYGRIFKLTGYTIGTQGNPFSAMVLADVTQNKKNIDSFSGGIIAPQNNIPIIDAASVFIAGKVTDNIGGFVQITYSVYDHQDGSGNWRGHVGSDNTDLRYTNRSITNNDDLILGINVNNNPGVQDVWNSSPTWSYPYVGAPSAATSFPGMPFATKLEDATLAQQVAGIGGYAYWNKSIYIELTGYQTATGFWKSLSQGYKPADPYNPLVYSQGVSPYVRAAYTRQWDDQNIMVGLIALSTNIYKLDTITNLPQYGSVTHYQDKGVDAQYQYLLDPHTVTAHFRYIKENINDDTGIYGHKNNLDSIYAKVAYIFRNQYGANIGYRRVNGSSDAQAYQNYTSAAISNPAVTSYSTSLNNSPETKLWTPEAFWLPQQNLHVGLQYNIFTEYLGAKSNYDGNKRNASDNNYAYLYAWLVF